MRTDRDGPTATHEGERYYFCSNTCKRRFEETPGEFAGIDSVVSGPATGGPEHH
jgi:hypothetical protein